MNHGAHVLIGILFFFAYAFFHNAMSPVIHYPVPGAPVPWLWIPGFFLAVIGSSLPDILEPAKNRAHRRTFHSKKTLRTAGLLFALTAVIGLLSPVSFSVSCFFLGYLSHLLADSTTRAGLPGR